jgi:hypothetical protein
LGQLLPAAQQLLDGFDRFLADGKLWATTEER